MEKDALIAQLTAERTTIADSIDALQVRYRALTVAIDALSSKRKYQWKPGQREKRSEQERLRMNMPEQKALQSARMKARWARLRALTQEQAQEPVAVE